MEVRLCIQDPTNPDTTYLYESIIEFAADAVSWRGVYAFASRDGVKYLLDDPAVDVLLGQGRDVDFLVGLDAVTNHLALGKLQEIGNAYENFRPMVFWNETSGLFHPKLSDFSYADGRRTLIVGSGNLTLGGLEMNYEGYTIIAADRNEEIDVSALDEFYRLHADEIIPIDDAALERAEQNVGQPVRRIRAERENLIRSPRRRRVGAPPVPAVDLDNCILIAQVPKAGDRWAQVHFNKDIVSDYFEITDYENQRVFLTHVRFDRGRAADPEVRRCLRGDANLNPRIEIGAASGVVYPDESPPLIVFRKRGLRIFDYMLLLPTQNTNVYWKVFNRARELPQTGRGLRRVITDLDTLGGVWANCPLIVPENLDGQEF